jgi:uncharacterized membrane protein YkoI
MRHFLAILALFLLNRPLPADPVKIPAGADNENTYAHASKIPLEKAISIALKEVPGRVSWAGMENFDGKLHCMVQVVKEDRRAKVVTLDAGSGAVEKVEDVKEKKKKKSPPAGMAKPNEWPFMAKISLEQAMKSALAGHPGKYVEVYLFDKQGILFYGIEISSAGRQISKVDVDAMSGSVVATEKM